GTYTYADIQRIEFNSDLVKSIKEIIGAQDQLNEKIKEYSQITIDSSTTQQDLIDKEKQLEFEMYQAQLLKIAASKDTSESEKERINDALNKNKEYSAESLETFQALLAEMHGDTQEFSASLSAVSEIFYTNLSNMFSKFSEVQQKAEIDSLLEKLGLPESFIEDARKKSYSLVEIYIKLFKAINDLSAIQKELPTTIMPDQTTALATVKTLQAKYPNVKFTAYPIGFSWFISVDAIPTFEEKPNDLTRRFTKPAVFGQEFADLDQKTDALDSYQSKVIDGAEKQNELTKIQKDLSEELNKTQDLETRNRLLSIQKSITAAQQNQLGMTKTQLKYYQEQVKSLKDKVSLEKQSNAENKLMLVRQAGGGFAYQFKRAAAATTATGGSGQTPQEEAVDLRAKNAEYLKNTVLDLVSGTDAAIKSIEALYPTDDPNKHDQAIKALNNFISSNGKTVTGNSSVDLILYSISSLVQAARDAKNKFNTTNTGTMSASEKAAMNVYTTAIKSRPALQNLDTGGYTGNSQGIAMLHQKELVLNKQDTRNILNAVNTVRGIPMSSNVSNFNRQSGGAGQNVTINANFPNVSSADEIKRAFASMSNDALQFNSRVKVVGAGV
ncbi:MAG: hypothetical protein EBR82_57900, partial [Caulobacteraceae bacterium]|nr:hypothetical protein [Caulobacteraceae bacterium]